MVGKSNLVLAVFSVMLILSVSSVFAFSIGDFFTGKKDINAPVTGNAASDNTGSGGGGGGGSNAPFLGLNFSGYAGGRLNDNAALVVGPNGNSYLSVDGAGDYLQIDNYYQAINGITISSWFNLRSTPNGATILSRPYTLPPWEYPYASWLLRVNDLNTIEASFSLKYEYNTQFPYYTATGFPLNEPLQLNRWYNLVTTYNQTKKAIDVYLDGQYIGSRYNAGNFLAYPLNSQPILVGAGYGSHPSGEHFNGYIDEVKLYNRALSGSEISSAYNSQKSLFPTVPTLTCTDTDGSNVNTQGTVTLSNGSIIRDSCYLDKHVFEYSCVSNQINYDILACGAGEICSNGACIQNNSVGLCSDTDGGVNINMKGAVVTSGKTVTDVCTSTSQVTEYSCDSNGKATSGAYSCAAGETCSNGACKKSNLNTTTRTCVDTDGGIFPFVKGTISGVNASGVDTYEAEDLCWVYEYLYEGYCDGNVPKTMGNFCPYGCLNGACVSSPPAGNVRIGDDVHGAPNVNFNDPNLNGELFDQYAAQGVLFRDVAVQPPGSSTSGMTQVNTSVRIYSEYGGRIIFVEPINYFFLLVQVGSPQNPNWEFELKVYNSNNSIVLYKNITNGTVTCTDTAPGYRCGFYLPLTANRTDIKQVVLGKKWYLPVRPPMGFDSLHFSRSGVSGICTDSDGGRNYNVKGTIFGRPLTTGQNPVDYCVTYGERTLVEYSCGGAGSESYVCPNGCFDGRCTEANEICSEGWQCYNNQSRAYVNSACRWSSFENCPAGSMCSNGACITNAFADTWLIDSPSVFAGSNPNIDFSLTSGTSGILKNEYAGYGIVFGDQGFLTGSANGFVYSINGGSGTEIIFVNPVAKTGLYVSPIRPFMRDYDYSAITFTIKAYDASGNLILNKSTSSCLPGESSCIPRFVGVASKRADIKKIQILAYFSFDDLYFDNIPISPPVPFCADTDGANLNIRGTMTNASSSFQDFCTSPTSVYEWTCTGNSGSRNCPASFVCGNGGACVQGPVSNLTATCIDTDSGKNIYTKGEISARHNVLAGVDTCMRINTGNFNTTEWTDFFPVSSCSGDNCFIKEQMILNLPGLSCSGEEQIIRCANGCMNGACIQRNTTSTGCSKDVRLDSPADDVPILTGVSVGSTTYYVRISYQSASSIRIFFDSPGEDIITPLLYEGDLYRISDSDIIVVKDLSRDGSGVTLSFQSNKLCNQPQVCKELIDDKGILYPAGFEGYVLAENESGRVNDELGLGNGTLYFAEYENAAKKKSFSVYTYVFDNKEVDIKNSKLIREEIKEELAWSGKTVNVNGVDYQYYTFGENDGVAHIWFNKNILIIAFVENGVYNENQLLDLTQFVNKLQNNNFEDVQINNEDTLFLERVSFDHLNVCPSTVQESCFPQWQKKLEPLICPEHGYQKIIYTDRNYCISETMERYNSCSAAICNGCYVPRWKSYNNGDNVCVPYTTRLAHTQEDNEQIYEGFEGYDNNFFNLTIIDAGRAYLVFVEGGRIEFDGSLILGETYNLDGDNYLISEISTSGRYVRLTSTVSYNAYCDIDGQIKRQQTKYSDGGWATCQNNYECASNVCSSGECIEVVDLIQQGSFLKNFVVRALCRLTNPFNSAGYDSCVIENLGSN